MSAGRPTNPLTQREERIVEANAMVGDSEPDNGEEAGSQRLTECPNPECDLTPEVCDLTSDGTLYVAHEGDGVGMDSRTPRGETDGCRVPPESDPTL